MSNNNNNNSTTVVEKRLSIHPDEFGSFTIGTTTSNDTPTVYNKSNLEQSSVAGNKVRGVYPCVWQNYNGSLAAGSKAVAFTGSFFLFDKTLIFNWDDIRKVAIAEEGISGLEIILKDDTVHTFRQMHSPDKVWMVLMTLHNDSLLGRTVNNTKTSSSNTQQERLFQRRNSDPAATTSRNITPLENVDEQQQDGGGNDTTTLPHQYRPSIGSITSMADSLTTETIIKSTGHFKMQPIGCTYMDVKGKLYTGENALFFTGKSYFWEHIIITIPWRSVRQVQVLDDDNNNNNKKYIGVKILTRQPAIRNDGGSDHTIQIFDFIDITEKVDQVWAQLITLHNEKLTETIINNNSSTPSSQQQQPQHIAAAKRRQTIRRLNSDPMMASQQINFDEYYNDNESSYNDERRRSSSSSSSSSSERLNNIETIKETPSLSGSVGLSSMDEDIWVKISSESTSSENDIYNNLVIDKEVITGCNLDTFYDKFLADDANFSLARYLEGRGDKNLQTTKWKEEEDNNNNNNKTYTRIVTYMHPVNAPLAPPEANARKEQKITRYGNYGIIIETKTLVDDVPMADCFHVADRIIIESSTNNNNNNNNDSSVIIITMKFGITFIKKTMFKGIISKTTSSEFHIFFKAMSEYIVDALAGRLEATTIIKEEMKEKEEEEEEKTIIPEKEIIAPRRENPIALPFFLRPKQISFDRALLFFVLLLQMWILFELRGIKRSIIMHDDDHHRNNNINSGSNAYCESSSTDII